MLRITQILLLMNLAQWAFAQTWLSSKPQNLFDELGARTLPVSYQLAEVEGNSLVAALEMGVVDLVLPDGSVHTFLATAGTNFAPALQQRYPGIKTYLLKSISNKAIKGRLDWSQHGLHVVLQHPDGEIYIDPYSNNSIQHYLIYHTKDYRVDPETRALYNNHEHHFVQDEASFLHQKPLRSPFSRSSADAVVIRTYRIAISATGEYTTKHDGTIAGALAAINTALNRVNFVMESELAIRLQLIEKNDSLIFFDAESDPFSNGNPGQMALENNNYLVGKLGSAEYDVGHVFGTSCNSVVGVSGGIGIVCGGMKGFGASCEISTSDRFYIGIVCHELGHQFGAQHTWNNCPPSPDGQFNARTAFEPGSGSTIMSYAGACGDQNIAFDSDNYYHSNSIEDIRTFVESGTGSCVEGITTTNHEPTVSIDLEGGFFIPVRTPFKLTAQGADEDGDSISYSWEQFDAGTGAASLSPIENPKGDAPIFRSLPPSPSPTRYFPALDKIINNTFDNTEVLPTYDRKLTFRATVRDHQTVGGGVAWSQISFRASQSAGQFKVMDETLPDTIHAGDYLQVMWDRAKSHLLPVDCQTVNILLSLDGGKTYPLILIENTANDGEEFVLIPDIASSHARIMIEAADNIFFDLNDSALVIEPSSQVGFAADLIPHTQSTCLPSTVSFDLQSFPTGGFTDSISIINADLPAGVTITGPLIFLPGDQVVVDLDFSQIIIADTFTIAFYLSSSLGDTIVRNVEVQTISSDFTGLTLREPSKGSSAVSRRPTFLWQGSDNADRYLLQVDDSPAFDDPIEATTDDITTIVLDTLLNENTLYYWRVRPENACGLGAFSTIAPFHTINLSCQQFVSTDIPKTLSQSGVVVARSQIMVTNVGVVSDVNVSSVEGFHESFGDLIFTLESPTGKRVPLLRKQCGFSNRTFKIGFDDQSLQPFDCQSSFNGESFQPMQSLSIFEGEPVEGIWILEVTDSVVGSGGRIEAWSLELCGALAPQSPTIILLDTLLAQYAGQTIIDRQVVEITDDVTGPDDLIFTLVTLPLKGSLLVNGDPIEIGSQFSQQDINDGAVTYAHTGIDSLSDGFTFTVVDGQGGWVGPLSVPITVSSDIVAAHDFQLEGFMVYPNPSQNVLYLDNAQMHGGEAVIRILGVNGVEVKRMARQLEELVSIDLVDLASGIYFLQLTTRQGIANLRFIKS